MVFYKATTGYVANFGQGANESNGAANETVDHPPTPIGIENECVDVSSSTLSRELTKIERGVQSNYAAKTLSLMSGWSYSDFDTFKAKIADNVGPVVNSIRIQVKNEPFLVQATAQMLRTSDKKVIIIIFRGTEMTNLANWLTDAVTKKSSFHDVTREDGRTEIKVHSGFKANFDAVWFGSKGILMHLLNPAMLSEDYDYDGNYAVQNGRTNSEQNLLEQNLLETVYICGHSLGGAMASLAGLYLGAFYKAGIFQKVRGVYTYGAPMVVDDRDRDFCERLCGNVTFRHVYYNDIVPHLPPLITGSFDHFGPEYRFHPRDGWQKRQGGLGFKSDRCTQVVFGVPEALVGLGDSVLDNIAWLNFFRGEDHNVPVIGFFSRGYLKGFWSIIDHSPLGYMLTLPEDGSLDA
ncbi:hypothetical protein ACA910_004046 [Epithemia clementina (nom. ined.)]